jgi:hypothetical protein
MICLPRETVERLKKVFSDTKITISDLVNMGPEKSEAFFREHLPEKEAQFVSGKFEEAISSEQKNAVLNFVKKNFAPELNRIAKEAAKIAKETGVDKGEIIKDAQTLDPQTAEGKLALNRAKQSSTTLGGVMNKIRQLNEMGVLNPDKAEDFMNDLVASKLGVSISPEEAKVISEQSKNLETKWQSIKDNGLAGDIMSDEGLVKNIDFQNDKTKLEKYIQGLNPESKGKVFINTIAPGNLLASVKSVMNIIAYHIAPLFTETAMRMFRGRRLMGYNTDLISKFMARNTVYDWRTELDTSRMMNLKSEENILGFKGENVQGSGAIRAVGRFYSDYIFGKLHNIPYAIISSFHFAHTADIFSSVLARSEGLSGDAAKTRAREIMLDAMKIEPLTEVGSQVRELARAAAEYGTYTNKTALGSISRGVRNIIPFGKAAIPFATIEANVISNGLDYAGVGMLKDAYKMITEAKNGMVDLKTKQSFWNNVVRAGIGITTVMVVANSFKAQDYDEMRDSLRVGNVWVSLKYFGPLAAPLRGVMMAKQKHSGVIGYAGSQVQEILNVPGPKWAMDFGKSIQGNALYGIKPLSEQSPAELIKPVVDFIQPRIEPMVISDIANAIDPWQRKVASNDIFGSFKKNIPGLSGYLPKKTGANGEPIPGENPLLDILSGANIKTHDPRSLKELETFLPKTNKIIRKRKQSKPSGATINKLRELGILK